MKTGEGKTLGATLPVYLNALEAKGVHVVTVNDYLAKRDAEWMGRTHDGLSNWLPAKGVRPVSMGASPGRRAGHATWLDHRGSMRGCRGRCFTGRCGGWAFTHT